MIASEGFKEVVKVRVTIELMLTNDLYSVNLLGSLDARLTVADRINRELKISTNHPAQL